MTKLKARDVTGKTVQIRRPALSILYSYQSWADPGLT